MEETIKKLKRLLNDYCADYCADIVTISDTHIIKEETKDHLWKVVMVVLRSALKEKGLPTRINDEVSFADVVELLYNRAYKDENKKPKSPVKFHDVTTS